MRPENKPTPDEALEIDIQAEYDAALNSDNERERSHHLVNMADLIGQRSPEQIARMETEKGLK